MLKIGNLAGYFGEIHNLMAVCPDGIYGSLSRAALQKGGKKTKVRRSDTVVFFYGREKKHECFDLVTLSGSMYRDFVCFAFFAALNLRAGYRVFGFFFYFPRHAHRTPLIALYPYNACCLFFSCYRHKSQWS